MSLTDLIQAFVNGAAKENGLLTQQGLEALKTTLSTLPKLRVFSLRSSAFGHQANTVNMMRRFIALGYSNPIELIYDASPPSRGELSTLQKLSILLPGLNPTNPQPITVGPCRVSFVAYKPDANPPVTGLDHQPLCINGGAELNYNLTADLNVDWYLQLQPFMWTKEDAPNLLWKNGAANPIKLTSVASLGGEQLLQRAFAMDVPTPSQTDWDSFAGNNLIKPAMIARAKALATALVGANIRFMPVYGLPEPTGGRAINGSAVDIAFMTIATTLLAQSHQGSGLGQKTVIAFFNDLGDSFWRDLKFLFRQPQEQKDDDEEIDTTQRNANTLQEWAWAKFRVKPPNSNDYRSRVRFADNTRPNNLTAIINNAMESDVILVDIPRPPQMLFNYFYDLASLPSIFEGQGTANLALNLGKPYFQLARENVVPYPTLPFGEEVVTERVKRVADTLFLLQFSVGRKQYEADTLTLRDLVIEAMSAGTDLNRYYVDLGRYYHSDEHDKLLTALLYWQTDPTPPADQALTAAASASPEHGQALLTDDPGPLEQFYETLKEQVNGGVLNLVPGALSSGPAARYLNLIAAAQQVGIGTATAPVTIAFPDPQGPITVSGSTTAFGKSALAFTAVFKLDDAGASTLSTDVTLSLGSALNLPAVPWFALDDVSIRATIPGNGNRVSGSTVAVVHLGGQELDFGAAFPAAENRILLESSFGAKPPTVSDLFRLLGGINFLSTLPGPLQAATNIGLKGVRFDYDFGTGKIAAFNVDLSTSRPWTLFGKLILQGLDFTVLVSEPTGARAVSWNAAGAFGIGAGTIDIGVSYPNLTVSGTLAEDSQPIALSDFLTFFLPDGVTVPVSGDLTALSLSVQPQPLIYSASCAIATEWPITVLGTTVFSVTELGFAVNGDGNGVTGNVTGTIIILPDDPDWALGLTVSAGKQDDGWLFSAQQSQGALPLGKLIGTYIGWQVDAGAYSIDGLGLTIATKNNDWTFTGKTAEPWSVPFIDGLSVAASLRAGWAAAPTAVQMLPPLQGTSIGNALTAGQAAGGYFARLETEWTWQNIDLKIFFDYAPGKKSFGISWGILQGLVEGPNTDGDYVASLKFTDGTTLGSIVETMVSWATGSKFSLGAPWDLLDSIPLNDLALVYTFNPKDKTRNHVSLQVDIGPIKLGFARIDSIGLSYQSTGAAEERGVMVTLNGSFRWQDDAGKPLGWDATKPETTPAPPGNGNKYIDLRLLAMGQHVTVDGLATVTNIQDAIQKMRDLPDPDPDHLPPPVLFDAGSSWLVGMDFGLLKIDTGGGKSGGNAGMLAPPLALAGSIEPGTALTTPSDDNGKYVVTLQVVFNDPVLYGLRLALAGDAAKIFKGLDFQIMYRQVSPTVGVYQAEITLPDAMRYLTVGAYSLTLPVFAIQVYTNGDFLVDIGFPWNSDFSRSFSVEAIIPPGIPLLGSAGLYFGKLSSATTSRVPQATNGTFNPVIVFGFGMQVGFGKSIHYGVLSAGFSVTVFGIIEGVIAKWNPYRIGNSGGQPAGQLQGDYYFWLQGTVGVIGKVFGTIDFAIIKADVDLTVKLMMQLTYESFAAVTIAVSASVSVSVSVRINLGLFKITIHFSFSMQLRESFSIDAGGTPPWQVAAPAQARMLRRPAPRRLTLARALLATAKAGPDWGNLTGGTPAPLTGYLVPALTVARDEWGSANLADQLSCAVALLVIQSVPPAGGDSVTNQAKAAGDTPDTSFELIAKMVLRWAVAALQGGPLSASAVDAVLVDMPYLDRLADEILVSTDAQPTPLTLDDIDAFLAGQFSLSVSVPDPGVAAQVDATCFPMPPSVQLDAPAYGQDHPGYAYGFGSYNALAPDALTKLRDYFDQLAVKVQQETAPAPKLKLSMADAPLSVAGWVFSDYFLLLARQMVKAAQDALHDFHYPIASGDTPNGILGWINRQGQLDDALAYTLEALFTANAGHPLSSGKPLTIGLAAAPAAGSFETIAAGAVGPLTGTQLALANAALAGTLTAGQAVTYAGASYTVAAGDTLIGIAAHFKVSIANLLAGSNLLTADTLPSTAATLLFPLVTITAPVTGGATDSLTTIAGAAVWGGGFDAAALAGANAGNPVLRTGAKISYTGAKPQDHIVAPLETLGDIANALGVSFADLLANSDVLTGTGVLAPGAQLFVPAFPYRTAQDDTLQGIATRFGVPLALLAAAPGNGDPADLFATSTSGDQPQPVPSLSVPDLPHFPVGALIAGAQRAGALQHLSGMVSRYMMHGMRLPTDGITPAQPGIWVHGAGPNLTLPPQAGLYALTGQQIPLPTLEGADAFTVTLDASDGATWLNFAGGPTAGTLALSFVPGGDLAKRAGAIAAYARSTRLAVPVTALGGGAMDHAAPASFPFSAATAWQSAGPVVMPYGTAPSGVEALRIWRLPDAMASLPDPATRRTDPRFALMTATYDPASGTTVQAPIDAYGWASTIGFTVKKIDAGAAPPTSPAAAAAATYEIVGAGGNDILLLERLVAQIGADDARFAGLAVAFSPESANGAASGLASDSGATVTFGISQVNLSTDTHPPQSSALLLKATGDPAPLGLLTSPSTFVRLLWEASITASGGFYLYYFDAANGRGLPDRLFNDRNEAQLTLVLLFHDAAGDDHQVTNFMNAAITATPVEAGSAVFALADPLPVSLSATATDTLAGLAQGYFDDPGAIAAANATVALAPVTLTVAQGVVQAPPGGTPLAALAASYGADVAAFNAANPEWTGGLPDPLPFPAAIRLPVLHLTCGASPHSATLQDIADFYGEPLTALGADNADVPGLFAGQTIRIDGGPNLRSATVGAGVQAVAAERPAPPPIPDSPDDPNFAADYLLNAFQLLGQRVLANPGFIASNDGLPAGPTVGAPPPTTGRLLATFAEEDVAAWHYSTSLPYARFAAPPAAKAVGGLPDPADNPYRGVGRLLQLWFDWQDQFGNRLITTLSDPAPADTGPRNAAPIPTGYSDPIVALGQWPSVRTSWMVAGSDEATALQIALAFDPTRYAGLLQARATDPSTVVATFTDPVDAAAAADLSRYQILPDKPAVTAATVGAGGLTVTLTLATPLDEAGTHTLIVGDIKRAGTGPALGGQAWFTVPDDQSQRSSSVVRSAQTALATLAKLYGQITDPNGFAFAVETTLLAGAVGGPGSVPVPQAQVDALTAWLFHDANSVYAYLADRAQFGTTAAPPASDATISVDLTGQTLNPAQIFELWLSLSLERTGGAVIAGLESTGGIRSVTTRVAPLQAKVDGETLGLAGFAQALEGTLSTATQRVKVAVGTNRGTADAGAAAAIWLVRLGLDAADPISFAPVAGAGTPTVFAPAPVSNRLQTRLAVPIYDYSSAAGISTVSRPVDFVDIDVDGWCEQIFAWIDDLLSPLFTAPIQILGKWDGKDYLQSALDAKEAIAGIAAAWMMPVFTDPGDLYDAGAAREVFRQQLLSRLSNAYTTRAAVQYAMKVNADVGETIAPRLFGAVGGPRPAFLWASRSGDGLTLTLSFSDPLDPGPAGTPGNYLLTDGVAVLNAAVSGATVTLTLSKPVAEDGSVQVQNLTDADGRPLVGVDARPIMADVYAPPAISLTSPKLGLAAADAAPLTFLISAPSTVHAGSGGVAKSIDLDLVFQSAQIEHQISETSTGYQASSWLSFVLPMDRQDAANPLIVPLTAPGQPLQVPMVLRAFPATPTVNKQEGDPSHDLDTATLEQMLLWDYQLGYSLPYHFPQDRITGTVQFNLGQQSHALTAMIDAFPALAEFVTVYPRVHADLIANLAPIDASSDPGGAGVATARVALGAFLQLIEGIAQTGSDGPRHALRVAPPPRRLRGDAPLTYSFTIEESWTLIDGARALLVTVTGALPTGMPVPPKILISPDAYDALPAPDIVPSDGSFAYVYKLKGGDTYLDDVTGQAIPGRTLLLPQLDILQRQDALGDIQLERNVDLVAGRTTAEAFVYTTALVTFAEPLFPTNDADGRIDISTIGSTAAPPAPVTRSLQAHLEALFTLLLTQNVQDTLVIQVEARYAYPFNAALSAVELPVLFQPPLPAALAGDDVKIPAAMIAALAEAIEKWFGARKPRGGGTLTFDLVIMSNETLQPMPLLRLRDLVLPISAVTPPLTTIAAAVAAPAA